MSVFHNSLTEAKDPIREWSETLSRNGWLGVKQQVWTPTRSVHARMGGEYPVREVPLATTRTKARIGVETWASVRIPEQYIYVCIFGGKDEKAAREMPRNRQRYVAIDAHRFGIPRGDLSSGNWPITSPNPASPVGSQAFHDTMHWTLKASYS